ncbi:MAG TPA: response regulator [Thermoanaerobaculia bacterium]|nr:response regulator [Thermoanaerobaculia bacterium]
MSLLGRLEDLSLTDIIQIVFLSRRTGVLEIIDGAGRHTVVFRHGLIVNASAPDHPDLVTFLEKRGSVPADSVLLIRQMEDDGIPTGTAVMEMNLMSADDLAEAIRERILSVVTPLLQSREGDFNFLLRESMTPIDIEYEPDVLFKEGGLPPQKIVETAEGEKIKPLSGLEESLKAGKDLLRGAEAPEPRKSSARFKVAGGLIDIETPESTVRNVILFERDPLVRVAVKRAFAKRGVKIFQFGSLDDIRGALTDLFQSSSFFVTFLELTGDDAPIRMMQQLKRRNPRLPVAFIDSVDDERHRKDLLRAGADLYLTRPARETLRPEIAEDELALFADELVQFAERNFEQWEKLGFEAGKRFYEEAEKEDVERSFSILQQFINELSDPDDVGQVAATILRLSAEFLERGALFIVTDDDFIGLGGFGATGGGDPMDERILSFRIARQEPSILADIAASREPHRGKLRRTDANVRLLERMGNLLPTEVVGLPIMHNERAVGILYGDNAVHRAPIESMTGLEIFLSQAGYAFGTAIDSWRKGGSEGL